MSGLVIDSSAIVAIVQGEREAGALVQLIDDADDVVISAATLVEVSMVVEARSGAEGGDIVERVLAEGAVHVVPVDEPDACRALLAWRRFGRGQHRAALNFGDLFTYVLADETGYPILCVGNDFAQTDLEVVPAR